MELKACPFCGAKIAEIRSNGIGDFYVICADSNSEGRFEDGCGARTSDASCESREQAAERWNTRTTAAGTDLSVCPTDGSGSGPLQEVREPAMRVHREAQDERPSEESEKRRKVLNAAFDEWLRREALDIVGIPAEVMNGYRAVWHAAAAWATGYNLVGGYPAEGTQVVAFVHILALGNDGQRYRGGATILSHSEDRPMMGQILHHAATNAANRCLRNMEQGRREGEEFPQA